MYQISSLTVTQIRIFRVDELPYLSLQMPSGVASVRAIFNFQQVTPLAPPLVPDPQGAFLFAQGEFADGEDTVGIPQLQIEPRRIVLISNSTSEVASKAFEALRRALGIIDNRSEKPQYVPIFMTEETASIVHFDFSIDHLFVNNPLCEFSVGVQSKIAGFGAKAHLFPSGIKYQVLYGELPEDLKAQGVIQLPKEIRIELRNQSNPQDNLYFVTSPNPTNEHLDLLKYVESTFSK
jgi:hypothetical protein